MRNSRRPRTSAHTPRCQHCRDFQRAKVRNEGGQLVAVYCTACTASPKAVQR